ncbi:MAG: RcpC/CpaB family pilus assembly protein [Acidimicrobiales bacterium]
MPTSLVVAIVAGLFATGGFLVVTSSHTGSQVAVAARDLRAGEVVEDGSLRFIDLTASDAVLATMVRPVDMASIRGSVATHSITAGSVVSRSDLAPAAAPAQQRAMSIPIEPEHAVGGSLQRGDVVDVVDSSGAEAAYVVTGAEVLSVGRQEAKGLGGVSSKYAVTIAVDERAALRVSGAIERGKMDIVRATGAPAAAAGSAVAARPR